MTNISITTTCNRQCSYCFAEDSREHTHAQFMSKDIFLNALEYLERSDIRQCRLLGGEPTMHPDFIWMIDEIEKRGLSLLVFSNGIISELILKRLSKRQYSDTTILLNTISPNDIDKHTLKKQKKTMSLLGEKVVPGVNIYKRFQPLDYLIDLINIYNLKREIRIGIAHPILSRKNKYLMPKLYQQIGLELIEFHKKVSAENINLVLDCGFVPCMFPPESFPLIEKLLEKTGSCLPNIDLLPDGTFISCYPLHQQKKIPLSKFAHSKMLSNAFSDIHKKLSTIGIYPHCSECILFQKTCSGGCIANKFHRLNYI